MKAFRKPEPKESYPYMYFASDRPWLTEQVQQVCDGCVIKFNRLQTLPEAYTNTEVCKKPPKKHELN